MFKGHSRPVRTLLELGSGGGNNASHMKKHFESTLTDISPEMLELSRTINPSLEHVQGDMRTLRLGRTFDGVFVHDAVTYLTSEADLEAAMRTAYEHLEPGGIALFVPDDTTENLHGRADSGGYDEPGRSLRYLEWSHPLEGNTLRVTFVYILRDSSGERVETEHHVIGVFPRATWISLLEGVGFEVEVRPYEHSEFEAGEEYELFVATK